MIISFMYNQYTEKHNWYALNINQSIISTFTFISVYTRLALTWLHFWTIAPLSELFENSSDMSGIFSLKN